MEQQFLSCWKSLCIKENDDRSRYVVQYSTGSRQAACAIQNEADTIDEGQDPVDEQENTHPSPTDDAKFRGNSERDRRLLGKYLTTSLVIELLVVILCLKMCLNPTRRWPSVLIESCEGFRTRRAEFHGGKRNLANFEVLVSVLLVVFLGQTV